MKEIIGELLKELKQYVTHREQHYKIRSLVYHDEDLETRLDILNKNLSKLSLGQEDISFSIHYLPLRNYSKNACLKGESIENKRLPIIKEKENIDAFPFTEEFKKNTTLQLLFILTTEKDYAIRRSSLNYAATIHNMLEKIILKSDNSQLSIYAQAINDILQESNMMILEVTENKTLINQCYVWQYPSYTEINQGKEKEASRLYKEGYQKVSYYERPSTSHSCGGTQYSPGGWRTEEKYISGSDANPRYFYPHREKIEDFKHLNVLLSSLQHRLMDRLVFAKLEEVNNATKKKTYKLIKIPLNKNLQQPIPNIKKTIEKLRTLSDDADTDSLTTLMDIYQHLTDKYRSLGPENTSLKKELQHFEGLLNGISTEPNQKALNEYLSVNTLGKASTKKSFSLFTFSRNSNQSYVDCYNNLQLKSAHLNDATVKLFLEILTINRILQEPAVLQITLPNSLNIEQSELNSKVEL